MTVPLLVQIDKLVMLIESPVFTGKSLCCSILLHSITHITVTFSPTLAAAGT
jgi:hypothetical protein